VNPTSRRWLKIALAGAAALVILVSVSVWPSKPEWIIWSSQFMERKGPEGATNGIVVRDRLIACGTNSIAPVIRSIRLGWWVRGHRIQFPEVLAALGAPGQLALQTAIESEREAPARHHLISAYQYAFHDYQYLDRWLQNAVDGSLSQYRIAIMAHFFRWDFDEAPLMVEGLLEGPRKEGINPVFLNWWTNNRAAILDGRLKRTDWDSKEPK
jgi:hypothetical protein